jgi:hypothetical protein
MATKFKSTVQNVFEIFLQIWQFLPEKNENIVREYSLF